MTDKPNFKNLRRTEKLALSLYLRVHEFDIANEINDFGDLRGLFIALFECPPRNERLI